MSYTNQIVLFSPSFPKNEENTIVVPPVFLLAQELKKQVGEETKITVVSLHFPFHNQPYNCFGIDVYPIGAANCSYPKRFLYWYMAVRLLNRLNKKLPVKLIHSFWLNECPTIIEFFTHWKSKKHVCTLMGQDVKASNKFLKILKIKQPQIIPINKSQSQEIKKQGFVNVLPEIPWGIEAAKPGKSFFERELDVVFVGSFISLKRPILFLEAIKILSAKIPNLKVKMVGYGVLENEIKNFIASQLPNVDIELLGKTTREEVFEFMEKAKVLMHTSNFEGGPMVFFEAWSRGCNVVSDEVGNYMELSHEKWKIAKTAEQFAENTKWFLQNGNAETKDPYTFDNIAKKYLNQYSALG